MDKMWKVAGDSHNPYKGTNASLDVEDWSPVELQKFVKWFMAVNHPEAVEQYQAIRNIERAAEEALVWEQQQKEMEVRKWMAQQQLNALNASYDPRAIYGRYAEPDDKPKKSSLQKLRDWIDGV